MGWKHQVLRTANYAASRIFKERAPVYLGGKFIWLDRSCWSSLYLNYEPSAVAVIKSRVKRGMTFWDVGANIGLYSLLAAKIVGPNGSVYSFEPSPAPLQVLRLNAAGNANVTVMPYGIGNQDGDALFAANGDSSAASFIPEVTAINQVLQPDVPIEQVPVRIARLDALVAQTGKRPDFIKIDIEGFELEALKGATDLLAHKPTMLIEIHPPQLALSGGSEDEFFQILRKAAYSWHEIDRCKNSIYTIVCNGRG